MKPIFIFGILPLVLIILTIGCQKSIIPQVETTAITLEERRNFTCEDRLDCITMDEFCIDNQCIHFISICKTKLIEAYNLSIGQDDYLDCSIPFKGRYPSDRECYCTIEQHSASVVIERNGILEVTQEGYANKTRIHFYIK